MRTVLANTQAVIHAWAHQTQDRARNGTDSVSFASGTLYSYATPIARIIWNARGEQAYLLSTRSYSPTTGKHQSWMRSAVPHGATVFHVAEVERGGWNDNAPSHISDMPRVFLAYYREHIVFLTGKVARARTEWCRDRWESERVETIAEANALCRFFDVAPEFAPEVVERLIAESTDREARANIVRERERAEYEATQRVRLAERVPLWLAGTLTRDALYYHPETLLRRVDDEVQTSRGASVPVRHAKMAFAVYLADPSRLVGNHLGPYVVTRADADGMTIGCHKLTRAEILRFSISQDWTTALELSVDDWNLAHGL